MAAKKKATVTGTPELEAVVAKMVAKALQTALASNAPKPPPKRARGASTFVPAPPPPMPNALPAHVAQAKIQHWWEQVRPALHSAWLYHSRGCDEAMMRSLVKALAEVYTLAHRNMYGGEPDATPPREYPPGYGDVPIPGWDR